MDTKSEHSVATGVGGEPVGRTTAYYDPEIGVAAAATRTAEEDTDEKFYTREIRQGFIKKVYGILSVQLLITTILTAVFYFVRNIRYWIILHGQPVVITAGVLLLIVSIPLFCCQAVARRYPLNYVLLLLFTCCESVLLASITCYYNEYTVFIALTATVFLTVGLSVFAFQVKYDFTSWIGVLFVLTLNLLIFGFFCLLLPRWAQVLYASLALLLFSVYLVVDTQLIVGRGKLRLSEDDYIVAALMLYVDIITIFLQLLRIVAAATDNN